MTNKPKYQVIAGTLKSIPFDNIIDAMQYARFSPTCTHIGAGVIFKDNNPILIFNYDMDGQIDWNDTSTPIDVKIQDDL